MSSRRTETWRDSEPARSRGNVARSAKRWWWRAPNAVQNAHLVGAVGKHYLAVAPRRCRLGATFGLNYWLLYCHPFRQHRIWPAPLAHLQVARVRCVQWSRVPAEPIHEQTIAKP